MPDVIITSEDWLIDSGSPLYNQIPHSQGEAVMRAIDRFVLDEPYYAQLLDAIFFEKLSYRKLAKRMNKRHPGSAWWAVQQALKKLKPYIEEELK